MKFLARSSCTMVMMFSCRHAHISGGYQVHILEFLHVKEGPCKRSMHPSWHAAWRVPLKCASPSPREHLHAEGFGKPAHSQQSKHPKDHTRFTSAFGACKHNMDRYWEGKTRSDWQSAGARGAHARHLPDVCNFPSLPIQQSEAPRHRLHIVSDVAWGFSRDV